MVNMNTTKSHRYTDLTARGAGYRDYIGSDSFLTLEWEPTILLSKSHNDSHSSMKARQPFGRCCPTLVRETDDYIVSLLLIKTHLSILLLTMDLPFQRLKHHLSLIFTIQMGVIIYRFRFHSNPLTCIFFSRSIMCGYTFGGAVLTKGCTSWIWRKYRNISFRNTLVDISVVWNICLK